MATEGIFISYRRDGGEVMAQLVYERLTAKGYVVFYDIESLNAGPFDTKLFEKIESCTDFILILPPQGLDRCRYEDDWVRQEISHAIIHNKNIVPVMMRGFEFPSELPEDISSVSRYNGIRIDNMNYLDAKIDKLTTLLQSKNEADADQHSHIDVCGKPSLIANVCTKGAVDPDDVWPNGEYTPIIDLDRFNAVRFHVKLLKRFKSDRTVRHGFNIYDSSGACVCEHSSELNFKAGWDMYSACWIIRESDGSYVKAGTYRAEFWIDDSRYYEITFRVASQVQETVAPRQSSTGAKIDPQLRGAAIKRIGVIERQLATPKGFALVLLSYISFFYLFINNPFPGMPWVVSLFGLVMAIIATVLLIKHTKKYIIKNTFLAMCTVIFGSFIYSIYLLASAVSALFNRSKLKKELADLKSKL